MTKTEIRKQMKGLNTALSSEQREELSGEIHAKAIAAAIAEISPRIIDAVNILQASRLAMTEAVKKING